MATDKLGFGHLVNFLDSDEYVTLGLKINIHF